MKTKVLELFCLFVAMPLIGQELSQSPKTPAADIDERLAKIKQMTITFDEPAPALSEEVVRRPGDFFAKREDLSRVFETEVWSLREQGEEWPLHFNDQSKPPRWELMPAQVAKCSEAQVFFAHQFLLAYAKLNPSLRSSNGVLPVGAAAFVAYESCAATNWAVLPTEVQQQAGIFAMLLLADRTLLGACFSGTGDPVMHAKRALLTMCAGTTNSAHRDPRWLTDASARIALASVVPPHAQTASDLMEHVDGLRLTLKAMLLAASAPTRLGLPYCDRANGAANQAAPCWQAELDQLLKEARLMLSRRHDKCSRNFPSMKLGAKLAPSFDNKQPEVCAADMALARPLLFMAARIDAGVLRNHWKNLMSRTGDYRQEFEKAIHQANQHTKVFKVIGSLPTFDVAPGRSDDLTGHLVFGPIARVAPAAAGEWVGLDTLAVPLTNIENVGEGKPIRGIWENAFVFARENPSSEPKWIKAGDVKLGYFVRGFEGADPLSPAPIDFANKPPCEQWFVVVATQDHPSTTQVSGVFFPGAESPLLLALQHGVCGEFPRKSWREARALDPKSRIFDGKGLTEITRVVPQYDSYRLIEYTLIHDQRRTASNLLVSLDDKGTQTLLAEARPAEGAPVKPDTMVLVKDGSTSIPVKNVIANPQLKPGTDATVVVGAATKRDQDNWIGAPPVITRATVGEFPTAHALKVTKPDVPGYFELAFSDNTRISLGWPGGWLLEEVGLGNAVEVSVYNIYTHRVKDGVCNIPVLAADGTAKQLVGVTKHEGLQKGFVLLELANLQYAALGGALVATESRPMHEQKIGLTPISMMSLSEGKPLPVSDPALKNISLKLYDPALKITAKRPLDSQRLDYTSRMLEIGAGGKKLVVAPGQHLPVALDNKITTLSAAAIQKGAKLLLEGNGAPQMVPVDSILPIFRALDQTTVATANAPGGIANVQTRSASLGFAENIGVALTVSGAEGIPEALRTVPQGEDGTGDARGKTETEKPIRGNASAVKDVAPVMADLVQQNTLINIGKAELETLLDRGDTILGLIKREQSGLHDPTDGPNAKWFLDLLQLAGQQPLSEAKSPGFTLNGHLMEHIKQRRSFLLDEKASAPNQPPLGGRTPSVLTSLLHAQMILAGLAHACGAHETAQALVRDSIELSIYAGCDTTQPVTSRLQKDLNLASSLRLPEIVFGDNSDTVPLNALALLRLKSWADANNLSTRIIANDSLSRKGLWAFWQSRVQASPFLSSLQQPPTKGSGWPQQLDEWISQRSKIARQRIAAVDAELRDANEVKQKKDDQDKLYHAVDN